MFLFYQPALKDGYLLLDEEESHHCFGVLRKKAGDAILVTDGAGSIYHCRIKGKTGKQCELLIERTEPVPSLYPFLHVAIAPTKNIDRTEWFLEKVVELGVDEVSLILTTNSERRKVNNDRLLRVMISAMKQSLRARLPKLNPLIGFDRFVQQNFTGLKLIAEQYDSVPLKSALTGKADLIIAIGPEGGFTKKELSEAQTQKFQRVSLGTTRLRTETAGVAAVSACRMIMI